MRDKLAQELESLAGTREDICLLSGDIGNRMFDRFKEKAPSRFINCGIAEGNMISMAAGMGLSGLRPVVYTIAPFITTRCLEQIKIGLAYHQSPVVLIGTGSGLSYSELGSTHHSFEDIAVLRSLPGINIVAPADPDQLVVFLHEALRADMPTYIRIGKKGEPTLHTTNLPSGIGSSSFLRCGTDILLLAIGPIIQEALLAADELQSLGISLAVANIGSIKPLDSAFLDTAAVKCKKWISLEEHSILGGLGTVLYEWLGTNNKTTVELNALGVKDFFIHSLGSQAYCRKEMNINKDAIIRLALSLIGE